MCVDWTPPSELPDLRGIDKLSIDTETKDGGLRADRGSGWPWSAGYVCGISVAHRANGAIRSHYIPIQHPDSHNFDREQVARWLKDHIAAAPKFITKNGLYDWGWLWADLGIEMPRTERLDEIDALATIVDENRYQYSLDALCAWRGLPGKDQALLLEACAALGLIANKRKKFKPQPHIWQLPAHLVGPYAETDAVRTLELFESLDPVLDRESTRNAYRLEIELLPMVHAMRRRGIRVDVSAAEQASDLLLRRRDAVLAEISEKFDDGVGMDEINGRKWLISTFDRLGIEYPRTEKGNPSFKRGKRGWMQHSPHWLPPLIAAADQLDQYGDNFLQKQILEHVENGRVYGEIHPHRSDYGGTRSLRFSYLHPPLQQMPKHDEELAPLIRGVFLPEEGEVWASADYSQQEFRLVVHYAVRRKLTGAVAARDRYIDDPGTDMHAYASELTGGAVSRQDGKSFNFMTIYGAGPETTALQIKKPLSETKALLALYHEKMPFISQLAAKCKNAAHRNGFFTLFNNARRHFNRFAPGGKLEKGVGPCERDEAVRRTRDSGHPWYGKKLWRAETYKALNALIQSAAAIQTKEWMLGCFREGVVPLLQMHDSLELSVSSPGIAEMVARLGEEVIKLEVPMAVDVKFGRTWGDAKHTWNELHAGTAPHVELSDDRERTPRESPKFSNDFDEVLDSAPSENSELPLLESEFETISNASSDMSPSPHICIHCTLDPPDGTERASAHDNAWMHERCEAAFIYARMAEEGLLRASEHETPLQPPTPPPESSPPPPEDEKPLRGNGHGDFSDFEQKAGSSKTETERDTDAEKRGRHSSDGNVHGDSGPKRGHRTAQWFYPYIDRSNYLRVDRHDLPNGERKFYQHHWDGKQWAHRVKGTYAERKIPYRLPELKAALQADPDVEVQICEGETDADEVARLGFVATTNPGGALSWTPEMTAWLRVLGVRRAAIHEDNDGKAQSYKGQKRSTLLAAELSDFIKLKIVRYPDVPEGEDVRWWLAHSHTREELEARIAAAEPAGIIAAEPYQFREEADIAPWQWLYAQHLLRGEVAGTAAMGGTGKSTLSIVEALTIASGRALLNGDEDASAPLRIVLINLEDTRDTMDRRIMAAMRRYSLAPADIGDRLIVKAKGEVKIKVARQLRSGDVERDESIIRALTRLMIEHRADVLSIDSFIRTHRVNENDNSAVQEVVECFEDIATSAQCAVHLWHHTRKTGGERATIEAARGAGAFVDACRSARILETMSAKEHGQLLEIQPDMMPAGFYFRAFNGKRNFAPPADQSDWFKLESIVLLNGDDVGVATAWQYPETWTDILPETITCILDEIDRGMPNGQRYSNHNAAQKRSAWPVVQKHCPNKTQDQCRRIISTWIKKGLLREDEYHDPIYDRRQIGLFARKPATDGPPPS